MTSVQQRSDWFLGGGFWLAFDFCAGAGALLLAYALAPDLEWGWRASFPGQPGAYPAALFFGALLTLSADIAGLHDASAQRRPLPVLLRVAVTILIALVAALVVLYLTALQQLGRMVFVQTLVLAALAMGGARLLFHRIEGASRRRLLVLLEPAARARLRARIEDSGLPFRVADVPDSLNAGTDGDRLLDLCGKLRIDELVVPEGHGRPEDPPPPWMRCLEAGLQVTHHGAFMERYFSQVEVSAVGPDWFLELDLRLTHPVYHRWKRFSDLVLSGIGLLAGAIVLPPVLLVIWIESGRPFFFRQERVGLRGSTFRIWKLRTMRERRGDDDRELPRAKDPRITRIGYLLRRTRLDELPQMWNIFRGDMSFIGPRPDWTDEAADLRGRVPYHHFRTLVKPGLTGWAQINYGYAQTDEEVREKLGFDLYYLKHASVLLDLQILLRTIGAISRGAR